MMDLALGGPVDEGEYLGPLLNGQPLHDGNCSDSVFGCMRCTAVISSLSDEERAEIGHEDYMSSCDCCKEETLSSELSFLKPWDEPGVVYLACSKCCRVHDEELARMDEDAERYDDEYLEAWEDYDEEEYE